MAYNKCPYIFIISNINIKYIMYKYKHIYQILLLIIYILKIIIFFPIIIYYNQYNFISWM